MMHVIMHCTRDDALVRCRAQTSGPSSSSALVAPRVRLCLCYVV